MEDDPVVQGKIIGDGLSVDFRSDREWTFQEKRIDCSHILAICSRRWQHACEKEQQWTNVYFHGIPWFLSSPESDIWNELSRKGGK
jgi:hypothetical protein